MPTERNSPKLPSLLPAALWLALAPAPALAKERPQPPERSVVGEVVEYALTPTLEPQEGALGGVWEHEIDGRGGSFVKVRLVDVQLAPGDTLSWLGPDRRVIERIHGRGPKDRGVFWTLSAFGDRATLRLEYAAADRYIEHAPFRIDRAIFGNASVLASPPGGGEIPESVCDPPDFEDVICYREDGAKWANVRASVGVMSVGADPDVALFCSGVNISPDSLILTNQHCIETQLICDSSEFVFRHYRPGCGDGSPPVDEWVSYRCDEVLAQSPFISCESGLDDLDYTLASVEGDPATLFGFVEIDPEPITTGEDLYIVQHPDGRPLEITHGGGTDVLVDGTVVRYFGTLDTEGGSSGSPVFRESDDRLVALHHCGGCESGLGNRGVRLADIHPEIEEFVCRPEVALQSAGFQDLVEIEGNGDAVIDPGETWSVTPIVVNTACSEVATNVEAEVAANPDSVGPLHLGDPIAFFGDLAPGIASPSAQPVEFEVDRSTICGGEIVLDLLNLGPDEGTEPIDAQAFVTAAVGALTPTTLLFDDFSDLDGWEIEDGGVGTGPAATWSDANPGNRSLALTAPFMIVDSDALGFGGEMDESLVSPPIDVSGFERVELQFTHDFRWYNGGNDEQADVDLRTAPTAPWSNVAKFVGADRTGTETIDITPFAAETTELQLRFRYYDAAYEWWWAIDDVFVLGDNGVLCNEYVPPPLLEVTNPSCPGPARLEIAQLTPSGEVSIGIARDREGSTVPNGPCAGTALEIGAPDLIRSAVASPGGALVRDFETGETTCGAFVQALDLTTCRTSEVRRLAEPAP